MNHPLTRRDFLKGTTALLLRSLPGLSQEQRPRKKPGSSSSAATKFSMKTQRSIRASCKTCSTKPWPVSGRTRRRQGLPEAVKPGETVGIKTNVWSYLRLRPSLKPRSKTARGRRVSPDKIGLDDHTVRTNPLFVNATSLIKRQALPALIIWPECRLPQELHHVSPSPGSLPSGQLRQPGALFKLPRSREDALNILCVLTPQFHGRGPHHFSRRFVWNYKGLIVGWNPGRVDATGLRLIMANAGRYWVRAGLRPVPKHIQLADTRHGNRDERVSPPSSSSSSAGMKRSSFRGKKDDRSEKAAVLSCILLTVAAPRPRAAGRPGSPMQARSMVEGL